VRILQLVTGEKWTGAAAVVFDQTAALLAAGLETQFGFVRESPLEKRLAPLGWARPLLTPPRTPLDYARNLRALRETLVRERFDAVHCHLSNDHWLAAAASRGLGVALARTFHHVNHVRRDPLSLALFRRTDAFAFANRAISARFGGNGAVLAPVVDTARFRPGQKPLGLLRELGIPEASFIVGTVGKLARGRGHEEAIAAAATLPEDAVLLHVGKGELRPSLEARARALDAAGRNFWAGYEEERLPDLYRAMDVLLFTGSGSDQGQRAILEAMASGVPVVALDLPGVVDLATDGEEGLVVSTPSSLPGPLRRLFDSAAERSRMSERARRRASAFTGESFAVRAREFYARLAARRSAGG